MVRKAKASKASDVHSWQSKQIDENAPTTLCKYADNFPKFKRYAGRTIMNNRTKERTAACNVVDRIRVMIGLAGSLAK